MAGRLYRMAKVVSANPASWGIVDANQISGFRTVATKADLYSIAACILSSSYGDGVTTGADAIGQVWHVQDVNKDFKLISWANRGKETGWDDVDGAISADINLLNEKIAAVRKTAEANATAIAGKADTSTVTTLSGKVTEIREAVDANTSAIGKKADTTTVNTVKENVATNKQNITNLTTQLQTTNKNLADFIALKGHANGFASLDAHGHIPLDQLANLDTTVYTVLGPDESLPTTNIKSCIYLKLIKDPTTDNNNKYSEYVYTGKAGEVYDKTKWEKLGEITATTELSNFYKKSEIDAKVTALNNADTELNTKVNNNAIKAFTAHPHVATKPGDEHDNQYSLSITLGSGDAKTAYINPVSDTGSGVMTKAQKMKLDGIAANANNYVHPTNTAATEGLYKVTVDSLGHVSKTTAVTKEDITKLGIPGSAPTIDTVMSNTSTNAVQNKVIYNAIESHKIGYNNFDAIVSIVDGTTRLLLYSPNDESVSYNDDNSACYLISGSTNHGGKDIPKLYYSEDGSQLTSQLLRDIDVTAITNTELNDILNASI